MTRWQPWELRYLEEHANDGAQSIADRLGRTKRAVEIKASKERVSLGRFWVCPRCGRRTYLPLTDWSGWCRRCSIRESRERAAEINRRVRAEIIAERKEIEQERRERQAIYADTSKKRRELRKLREGRERTENTNA